eukprot:1748081-Lingulodinium_polyedra.AAC.1
MGNHEQPGLSPPKKQRRSEGQGNMERTYSFAADGSNNKNRKGKGFCEAFQRGECRTENCQYAHQCR